MCSPPKASASPVPQTSGARGATTSAPDCRATAVPVPASTPAPLQACPHIADAQCGTLAVPLDRSGTTAGHAAAPVRRDGPRRRAGRRPAQRRPRPARAAVPGEVRSPPGQRREARPPGRDRPARDRQGRAALPGAAEADGRVGPDAADRGGGDRLRERDRRHAALLHDDRHRPGPRSAARRARRLDARARRRLLRLLCGGALRAGLSGAHEQARARLRRPPRRRGDDV